MRSRQANLTVLALLIAVCFAGIGIAGFIQPAGVEVDADGVLRTKVFRDPTGALTKQRMNNAKASLNKDMLKPSRLRKVSLKRLEAAIAKLKGEGKIETQEMMYLAGLKKITHVFYYPEEKEIVIAGPAEGFYENIAGRVVSLDNDSPVLRLDDLVAALRAFSPLGDQEATIGCSIDPTQDGLKQMQQYLQNTGRNIQRTDAARIARSLKENLGLQEVSIKGVSPKTHFAQVLVEADYRMKMIGIGLERPGANIASYVSKANPRDVARNALQRWYFTPNYDCISVSEDDLAMELVGSGVKLIGADERVGKDGVRVRTGGKTDRASKAFTSSFTKNYDRLATTTAVYAEMQNLFDLAIVAAYIQHQDYYSTAEWDMELFGDETQFSIETFDSPTQVESAVNAVWKGNLLMTPIGGGVVINATKALTSDNMSYDQKNAAESVRKSINIAELDANQWWWD